MSCGALLLSFLNVNIEWFICTPMPLCIHAPATYLYICMCICVYEVLSLLSKKIDWNCGSGRIEGMRWVEISPQGVYAASTGVSVRTGSYLMNPASYPAQSPLLCGFVCSRLPFYFSPLCSSTIDIIPRTYTNFERFPASTPLHPHSYLSI